MRFRSGRSWRFPTTRADIEEHQPVGVAPDKRRAARHRQPGFCLPGDDFKLQAGLRLDAVEKFGAVLRWGTPRWQSAGEWDGTVLQLSGADLERLDGAVHGIIGEPARRVQPLAELTMREKASTTRNWPGRSAGQSAGGNCWCPDPAPHRDRPPACAAPAIRPPRPSRQGPLRVGLPAAAAWATGWDSPGAFWRRHWPA